MKLHLTYAAARTMKRAVNCSTEAMILGVLLDYSEGCHRQWAMEGRECEGSSQTRISKIQV